MYKSCASFMQRSRRDPSAFSSPTGFSTLHGVHHTNRPHRCHLCFRAFGNKAHLRRHLLSHTGEKPFGCPFCERRFSQACNAKVHVANVHSQAKTRSKPAFEYPGAMSFRYAPRSGNGQQRL
uniref:Putative transcriptional repressor salm n=1 Tax=Ixodes ricinus TaxID=34613 RepID=A0A6B0UNY9_IXORI